MQPILDLSNKRVFLVGCGPSLKGFDFERLHGKGIIVGINHSIFDLPCDIGVSIDQRFIFNNGFSNGLRLFSENHPLLVCPPEKVRDKIRQILPHAWVLGESAEFQWWTYVVHRQGGTSGYAALDIVASRGAKDIVLLGFDYGTFNGEHHYHGGYPWEKSRTDHNWKQWAYNFIPLAAEFEKRLVRVLNASPQSSISCFPKVTIDEVLEPAKEAV